MRAFADLWGIWPDLVLLLHGLVALGSSVHVILYKKESRATVGWLGLIWLSPFLGSLVYFVFGINRIRRQARQLRSGSDPRGWLPPQGPAATPSEPSPTLGALADLARVIDRSTPRRLLAGNRITPFWDGDDAYPVMLAAIAEARVSVALCSYIFDDDVVGRQFADALAAAVERSVEVRVLVDGAGVRYSRPPIDRRLRRSGVRVARFLPTALPWRARFINLRNHRKLLVTDGRCAFTGGMNIRAGHAASSATPHNRVLDVHFGVTGPVVAQLQEVFAFDWQYTTGEALEGEAWFPQLAPTGSCPARAISDGPDEDYERFLDAVFGALACAKRQVYVATPYFLPEEALLRALGTTVARGVDVRLVLPARTNVPLIQWGSTPAIEEALRLRCRVFLNRGPFSHTKLVVVDRAWTLFGSANWDPRSTQLNFELNVEAYDPALAERCASRLEAQMTVAQEVDCSTYGERGLLVRIRNGLARLGAPYL